MRSVLNLLVKHCTVYKAGGHTTIIPLSPLFQPLLVMTSGIIMKLVMTSFSNQRAHDIETANNRQWLPDELILPKCKSQGALKEAVIEPSINYTIM